MTTQTMSAEAAATPEMHAAGLDQVVHLDPHTLVLEDNIRTKVKMPRWFLASVRQNGVITPLIAHPGPGGTVVVRDGQMRTLAAREVGCPTVPVWIVDRDDERRLRIIEQYITGVHRLALSERDKADAWRQLSLDGMSVTAISRQTGAKREDIRTGIAVADHETAAAAVADYDLTLDQAAVLIELDDDPDAVAKLREVAKTQPEDFDHAAQRARNAKTRRDELDQARADLEAKGYTIIDRPTHDDDTTVALDQLQTANGQHLTEKNYAGKPGHAVAVTNRYGYLDIAHFVVDWRTHGLRKIGSTGTVVGGKLTEAEKAQRRQVIANNQAWDAAETVRREWLTKLLARKRLPADAAAIAAMILTTHTGRVARAATDDHQMAATLLGQETRLGERPLTDLVSKTPSKAGHVILAIALGAMEDATSRYTWRNPTPADRDYLNQLTAWGYTLSDVEQIVTADPEQGSQDPTEPSSDDHEPQPDDPAADADAEDPEYEDTDADGRESADAGEARHEDEDPDEGQDEGEDPGDDGDLEGDGGDA
ncbi:ParB/RepB/Spo0J family partition protein [Jiangella alkaliphila]|uniref:Chromosome partitioning protein, ParB family n=1 Tax=Jiangella alkaliphila TaxID=419479 RepID=A0A1H2L963_9ACTN|nr:ParB N-terminal domain-containing protein [Jiangella alkaliphila]SDU77111.1 chromosome partitioning protein, ParB family [Jiangella alkaliphila]